MNKLTLLLIPVLLAAQTSVETILTNRVDESRRAMGLIIGTLDKEGVRKIAARGKAGAGIDRPLDGDTVFEIGSITKVFTSLLLSDMIERGEVKPDDPVSKYLPEGVTVPARGGKQTTPARSLAARLGAAAHAGPVQTGRPRESVRRLRRA